MPNSPSKTLVIRSLRVLGKQCIREQFAIQRMTTERSRLARELRAARERLTALKAKVDWELGKHGDILRE